VARVQLKLTTTSQTFDGDCDLSSGGSSDSRGHRRGLRLWT
jgi:hypothetical protein